MFHGPPNYSTLTVKCSRVASHYAQARTWDSLGSPLGGSWLGVVEFWGGGSMETLKYLLRR